MNYTSDKYSRSNRLMTKKMLEYLLPTMLTMAALSLNEFVDSMIVSNLLGSSAMAIVGFGSPVMLTYAALYTLFGNGGATLYALSIGKRDILTAGKSCFLAVVTALIVSLLLLTLSFIFFKPLTNMLCSDQSLTGMFIPYLRTLLLSAPFIITILTLVEFLPPSGAPKVATIINMVANGINLLMDYVYIEVFGMGVEGAAWATLTGYITATILLIFILLKGKIKLHYSRAAVSDVRILGNLCGLGSPSSLSQLGFALKYAFCNGQAVLYGGTAGIVAYSLCNQTLSIVSIFLASLMGASMPLIAVLHGQRDFVGETGLLKTALKMNGVISLICFVCFVIFAEQLAAIYNITSTEELALAVTAVRIFSVMYLFRGFYMLFMKYLQAMNRKFYAMFVSIFDGFGGIIPIAFVMGKLFGLTGLWLTFPFTSILLLGIVIIWNHRIVKKSNGHYHSLLLAANEDEAEAVLDITIFENAQSISSASMELQEFCINSGIDCRVATHAALTLEEMAIYTRNRLNKDDYMDILVRLYQDRVEIDFRSLGNSFDPLVSVPEDISENIKLLRGIASSLEYDYIMGMNCTRIIIARKEQKES